MAKKALGAPDARKAGASAVMSSVYNVPSRGSE